MSGLCKRSTLSSLIINLISLSCGPDTPVPGPVDVKATGTYRVHRKDGTLIFERKIDEICVTSGRIVPFNSDEKGNNQLRIALACFDKIEQKNMFFNQYELPTLSKSSNPTAIFEGGFYFPTAVIQTYYLNELELEDDVVNGDAYYDNYSIESNCIVNDGRINLPVSYSFNRERAKPCGVDCKFNFNLNAQIDGCDLLDGNIEFYVSGIKYE